MTFEVEAGRFSAVTSGTRPPPGARRLAGLVLPGLANAHSHAFHRALRGRTERVGGGFFAWREAMYALAERLTPDAYLALARAAYAEMALAGVTTVGEFHYLHSYGDEMAAALVEAAREAGIRITLIETCYLAGGLTGEGHLPPTGAQELFADKTVADWAARLASVPPAPHLVVGAAAHSVRAVPAEALRTVAEAAGGRPLHAHVSEVKAENSACLAYYGLSPTQLLAHHGILGPSATAVHATHASRVDIGLLARSGTAVCLCPTTERNLGDGFGPARQLAASGVKLCLGSDQGVVVDPFAEAQALEMDGRALSGARPLFPPGSLVEAMAANGHAQLGWPDCGRLEAGARADLVALLLDSPRTAGAAPEQVVFAAGAADIETVVVEGRTVVAGGEHFLGDVGKLLAEVIGPLWA